MIKIISFIDSFKHYDIAIKEFQKRLWKEVDLVKLKPVKNGNIIEKETDILVDLLNKENWFKIVLNPNGKNLTTEEFYNLIESKKQNYKNIIFIIGWANWINYSKIKDLIDFELNFWKMIMPHILIVLVLIEQIYRINMIKKWTSYHK
jgi:23S rRNA (pseudouridine1915-N3)-methyltransferase